MSGPQLDHVVLATRSRADADTAIGDLGLTAGSRRALPGTGLSNVVVAVGSQLLEIHHPDGSEVTPDAPPYGRIEQRVLADRPDAFAAPVAWVLRLPTETALRETAERLGYPVVEIPAEPPNNAGHLLTGLGANLDRPWLPIFMHWVAPPHVPPRLADATGEPPAGHLELEISAPEDALREWCPDLPDAVSVQPGRDGPLRVRIVLDDGTTHVLGGP
ncbi:VOC family protein [Pseudonocardia phyllosphaerae]|uniref:VOC family protein n=1 Tax=Pseudonocardia phyllosphaerae TaxID=3390502 RepID=UPI00397E7DA0